MVSLVRAFEVRFVLPGPAVSFRSPKAAVYKKAVAAEVRPLFSARREGAVELRIDYFHSSRRRVDVDNIAKCIMDALNGVAYADDRLARIAQARAHDVRHALWIWGGPVDLIKPLAQFSEYLIVRVRYVDLPSL